MVGLSLLLGGCGQRLPAWNSGQLTVIVPEASQGAEAEFERELARLFAEQLHASLNAIPLPPDKIRPALANHEAHLAAASLRSEFEVDAPHFGPSYQSVRELVVCKPGSATPNKLADLALRKISVASNSAQEAALRAAQRNIPALRWFPVGKTSTQELLAKVADGALDCVAANELQIAYARNLQPGLSGAFDIGAPSRLAWAFPRDVDPTLFEQVQAFFARIRQDGTLRRLLDRFYGHNERLATMDSATFITRSNTILPDFRHLFEEAATLTGEDWRLLAAIAYQESQWDPLATSFTNVRGMMMLTEDTADQMKVENRLDARASIIAGARYLVMLKEQMPERIPEPDRTWLALAAYNQGFGHMEDARILTVRAGLNPDSWTDVKKWMPLLSEPDYFETVKHGYARGGEAVIMVENIRSYYDMLKRLEPERPANIAYRLVEPLKRLLR